MNELTKQLHEIKLENLLKQLQATSETDRFGIIEDEDGYWIYKEVFDNPKVWVVDDIDDLDNYRLLPAISELNIEQQHIIISYLEA